MSEVNVTSATNGVAFVGLNAAQGSRKGAWQQLGQDLQSGNLQAAQQDFATLQQAAASQVPAAASSSTQDPQQALTQALQSGNLAAAQQAFAQLQQAHGHHHHHHGAPAAVASADAAVPAVAPTEAGTSGVNLTA